MLDILVPLPTGQADTESTHPPLESSGSLGKEQAAVTVIQQTGPQTPEALAEKVGLTAKRVEAALTHLKEQFLVDEFVIEGEPHYFRVE